MKALSLADRRKAAGLSQQTLASLAGCSITMVSLLERGLQPATSEVLQRVEGALAYAEREAA